ncbi:putative Macrolide export ATP-binding/permease protein MacB 1/2 [Streptomyces afghaniensis 772]|uniref:Putative Macrolide export ATP-binding/permease protein MacB 1/2 n=1 Tax=Streptomyces afghaniensis 772 TaxID=1283301 RepID=S4MS80_9ACTN|nr:putative Macrolide export ATP-binding/permease protein MacB 1/2 [Streptomyces afghaniensis 772]
MSGASAVVEFDGVSKTYPGGVAAVRDVSLSIGRGELVAVVGPSGSGKSSMLNLMGSLDRPSAGRVLVDGHDVAKLTDREVSALRATRIGFVFQQFHLAVGFRSWTPWPTGCCTPGYRCAAAGPGRRWRWNESASATASTTSRTSCPAASASGWRWPGR